MSLQTFEKTSEIVTTILNCADEYFHKFGYKKTTVDEIASRAHISKKTLYSVFSSKEAVLRELAWRDTIEIVNKIFNSYPPVGHPDTLLQTLCRFLFTDRIKQGKQGLFWGIHVDDNIIRTAYLDALKRVIKDIYDNGRRDGLFKPTESVFATEAVVTILTTALNHFHRTSEPVRIFNDAINMIADAVASKKRTALDRMG